MEITSEHSASQQLRLSLRKYRVWTVVAATVIAHLLIAARSVGPMYVVNEVGYLAGANVIAGNGAAWTLCGAADSVGYSAFLAPLWWLHVQPVTVYQLAALAGACLGALAIWPATALARKFGAARGVALAIGALVTLIPARALMDNYVVADNALTLLILCAALVAVRLADRHRRPDAFVLAGVVGLAAVVDSHAIPLAAVTVAWLLTRAVLNRTPWFDAVAAAVITTAFAIGGLAAQTAMGVRILSPDSGLANLVGHATLLRVGEVILGQAFAQVVSWLLLTVMGLAVCMRRARGAVRKEGPLGVASAWWWLGTMILAQACFVVWTLAGSAEFETRFDIPILGSELDPFVVPIAVLGAVALWKGASKRLASAALITSAIAVVAFAVVVVPFAATDMAWKALAVPGLTPFLAAQDGDHRHALVAAGLVAIVLCVLLWLSRGRARLGLSVALIVATAATIGTDLLRIDPKEESVRTSSTILEFVNNNPDIPVTLAADLLPCGESNKLQLELAGRASLVKKGGDYGDGAIVGPDPWPYAKATGLIRVPYTQWEDVAIWARVTQSR